MDMTKKGGLLALLMLSLILYLAFNANAQTFSWAPNYYNYINYTSFGTNAIYLAANNPNIGPAQFNYIPNLNGTIPNFILNGGLLIEGYNSTGSFMGKIPAYPFQAGLLIPKKTLLGQNYTTASIFFNQAVAQNTYYYSNYSNSTSDGWKSIGGLQAPMAAFVYLANSSSSGCRVIYYDSLNQTCSFTFSPQYPYYLYGSNIYPYYNISLNYVPANRFAQFQMNFFNTTTSNDPIRTSIRSYGMLGTRSLSNSNNIINYNYPIALISSTKYYLDSAFIGAYSNGTIFNATASLPGQNNLNSASNLLNFTLTSGNTIASNFNSFPEYYFLPVFNATSTNSIVFTNATPKKPLINTTALSWLYGQPINSINWTFEYNYSVYPTYPAISHYTQPADYLELVVPHYSNVLGSCSSLQLEFNDSAGSITSFGYIPYAVISCNATSVKVILTNTTTKGFTFSNAIILMGNNAGVGGWNNQSILSGFEEKYNHVNTTLSSSKLWAYLELGSIIGANESVSIDEMYLTNQVPSYNGGSSVKYSISGAPGINDVVNSHSSMTTLYLINITPNAIFNITAMNFYGEAYNSGGVHINFWNNATTDVSCAACEASYSPPSGLQLNLFRMNYTVVLKPFSVLFALGQAYSISSIAPQNSTSPTLKILPQNNNSLLNSLSNISTLGNQTAFVHQFGANENFMGFIVPEYYFLPIIIVLVIVFVILLSNPNTQILAAFPMFGMWAVGILGLAIASNYIMIVIALILTLYYVAENGHRWFK
jgi:hypothetical protein